MGDSFLSGSLLRRLMIQEPERVVEITLDIQKQVVELRGKVAQLEQDILEDTALHELAAIRERPWVVKWRRATGRDDNVYPDYGEILGWIISQAEETESMMGRFFLEAQELLNEGLIQMPVIGRLRNALYGSRVEPLDIDRIALIQAEIHEYLRRKGLLGRLPPETAP